MQRRNLAKKNDDLYNVDRKFCKLFCGFADSLDEAQKQVPAAKKAPGPGCSKPRLALIHD